MKRTFRSSFKQFETHKCSIVVVMVVLSLQKMTKVLALEKITRKSRLHYLVSSLEVLHRDLISKYHLGRAIIKNS